MTEVAAWPRSARAVVGRAAKQALEASGYYRRRLRRLTFPGVAALCYHGLLPGTGTSVPFAGLHITRDVFEGHCRLIAETCDPISLADLHAVLAGARPMPPRPVVITFDDGYASLLELALPVLERYRLPAAVFVCTGPVERGQSFWFDAVARRDGEDAVREARAADPDAWRRVATAAVQADVTCATHRPLRTEELSRLADSSLVTIGAHTVDHPTLARLSEAEARIQVAESRAWLERIVHRPVTAFAYPYGLPTQDYSSGTVDVVRDLGFRLGFTTVPGFAAGDVAALEVPRFMMLGSVDATELAHRLSHSWHPSGEAE
jgi:peptidoglycan/xylan/chitin deacetylase (PgdA/CDA1 family)